jgi:hypothetical protein
MTDAPPTDRAHSELEDWIERAHAAEAKVAALSQGSHTAPEWIWHIGQGLPCGCHMRADESRQVIDIQA